MAFEKKTWTDRVAEFINRRTLTHEDGTEEIVTVARNEGSISVEGDAFNAETMNDLEQRIADGIAECFQSVSDGKAAVATALTNKGVATASDATFETMASNIDSIELRSGTARIAQVLEGYTFTNDNGGPWTGTMPARGAWTANTSGSGKVAIPNGWHSGAGYVDCSGAYNAGYEYARVNIGTADGYAYQNVNYSGTASASESFQASRTGVCIVSIVGNHGHSAQDAHGLSYKVTRNGVAMSPFQIATSSYQQTVGFAFGVTKDDTIAISASYANVGGDTQTVNVVRVIVGVN